MASWGVYKKKVEKEKLYFLFISFSLPFLFLNYFLYIISNSQKEKEQESVKELKERTEKIVEIDKDGNKVEREQTFKDVCPHNSFQSIYHP